MALGFLGKYRDAGLFILRVGLGICYLRHGWPKISNPAGWEALGHALGALGIDLPPAAAKVFGFLAAISEFGGGICLILGFFFRPACIMMASTMAVALATHLHSGDPYEKYSHPLENLIVFVSLVFIGPGKVSVERG